MCCIKFYDQWFYIFQPKQSLTGKEIVTLVCGSYICFLMQLHLPGPKQAVET